MTRPRVLVAGIGNIFLGDDGFGVEVVQRLLRKPFPETVRVVDFGIRGLDLTYALLDGYETAILIDAAPRGGAPGTLYVIEPEPAPEDSTALMIEPHNLDPAKVLRLAAAMGAKVKRLLVVGCEPKPADEEQELHMEMSDPVRAAVDEAVVLVETLLAEILVTV
jgi:hydrogenase maturation protease